MLMLAEEDADGGAAGSDGACRCSSINYSVLLELAIATAVEEDVTEDEVGAFVAAVVVDVAGDNGGGL
ncbi:hypothetical protein ACLOJK_023359 [Asimina triloba]